MRVDINFKIITWVGVLLTLLMIQPVLGQDDDPTSSLQFERIEISPNQTLNGEGRDIDTIAFWIAPDPLDSLMFVTAKRNDIVEIWRYPFDEDSEIGDLNSDNSNGCLGGDRVNGALVNQETNLLYIAVSAPDNNICIFRIDSSDIDFVEQIDVNHDLGSEPNLALLHHRDGQTYIYLSADDTIYIYDADNMDEIGEFDNFDVDEIEVVFGDDFYQHIYVPDENDHTGVYVYAILNAGMIESDYSGLFGADDIFDEDAEGVTIYRCLSEGQDNGTGWIVVADQREELTDFEFFDREHFTHLGTLNIEDVANTDGIASAQIAWPDYELGVFAAINDDHQVIILSWERILEATGLRCKE